MLYLIHVPTVTISIFPSFSEPCTPTRYDTLQIVMSEVTQTQIASDPYNEQWTQPLGIYGRLDGEPDVDGVVIRISRQDNSRISDPRSYFAVFDGDDGRLMIRLIQAVDRDVRERFIYLFSYYNTIQYNFYIASTSIKIIINALQLLLRLLYLSIHSYWLCRTFFYMNQDVKILK